MYIFDFLNLIKKFINEKINIDFLFCFILVFLFLFFIIKICNNSNLLIVIKISFVITLMFGFFSCYKRNINNKKYELILFSDKKNDNIIEKIKNQITLKNKLKGITNFYILTFIKILIILSVIIFFYFFRKNIKKIYLKFLKYFINLFQKINNWFNNLNIIKWLKNFFNDDNENFNDNNEENNEEKNIQNEELKEEQQINYEKNNNENIKKEKNNLNKIFEQNILPEQKKFFLKESKKNQKKTFTFSFKNFIEKTKDKKINDFKILKNKKIINSKFLQKNEKKILFLRKKTYQNEKHINLLNNKNNFLLK